MEWWMAIALLSPIVMLVMGIVNLNQEIERNGHEQAGEKPTTQVEQRRAAA